MSDLWFIPIGVTASADCRRTIPVHPHQKLQNLIFPTKKQPRRFPIAFGSRLFHEGQFAVANAIRRDAIEEDDVIIGEIDRDLFAHRVVNNAEDDRSEDRFIDLDLEGRFHAGRKGGDDFGLSYFAGDTDDELQ